MLWDDHELDNDWVRSDEQFATELTRFAGQGTLPKHYNKSGIDYRVGLGARAVSARLPCLLLA